MPNNCQPYPKGLDFPMLLQPSPCRSVAYLTAHTIEKQITKIMVLKNENFTRFVKLKLHIPSAQTKKKKFLKHRGNYLL